MSAPRWSSPLVSGMTEFAANLYPLKTEEELVALLSGMHHFPPGVPERARRVHERLPAGSALCSSDVCARSMESRFLSSSKAASGMRSLAPPSTSTAEAAFARACSMQVVPALQCQTT